ncbi:MAG: hypothetical protein FJW29_09895 [Acidobacteria bacterium]|nr:hypothetical protein [Acidobacteriota bacterium]
MHTMPLPSLALAAALVACGAQAHAQGQATLHFAEGRVSVSAANVPLRTLLEDWARLGQTRIVNLDRVVTTPVSITLENVPEAEALEVIMRSAAGYMAAPRAVRLAGASTFDRILVMPVGSASGDAAADDGARRGAGADASARQRRGRGTGAPSIDPVPMPDIVNTDADSPFGQPVDNPFQANPFMNAGQPPAFGQPTPFGTPVLPGPTPPPLFGPVDGAGATFPTQNPFLQLTPMQPSGAPLAPAAGPSNGLGGATLPGVVMPTTPPPAGTPGRPPGGA